MAGWRHALSGCLLIFAVAEKCHTGVCKSDLAPQNGHAPLAGKGVSLLQAMSRNKSASKNATTTVADPSSTSGASNGTNLSIGNISGLEDVLAVANAVGSAAAVAAGIQDQHNSTGNETGFLVPEQNLSSASPGVNYSVVSDEEVAPPEPQAPYAAAENSSKDNSSEVVKIHPIPGASPLPEPDGTNLTSAMKDCIMADWGEWSECLTDNANGYAGPHQVRERSIVQPYLPGGELCGLTMESRTCQLISAANTLVNLGDQWDAAQMQPL